MAGFEIFDLRLRRAGGAPAGRKTRSGGQPPVAVGDTPRGISEPKKRRGGA